MINTLYCTKLVIPEQPPRNLHEKPLLTQNIDGRIARKGDIAVSCLPLVQGGAGDSLSMVVEGGVECQHRGH